MRRLRFLRRQAPPRASFVTVSSAPGGRGLSVSALCKITKIVILPYIEPMKVHELPDALLAEGRYSASTEELLKLTGLDRPALLSGLHRLRQDGSIVSPARGLYTVVAPQYRSWGGPPAEWFIDAMMVHLGRAYYVALLTAAAMHGAAHQAPQTFQVIADKHVPDRELGRNRLRFYTSRHVSEAEVERRVGPSGYLRVATRETTAVDLAQHPRQSGGLSNVATVLIELGDLDGLRVIARPGEGEPSPLSVDGGRRGQLDHAWWLRLNTEVQPDL